MKIFHKIKIHRLDIMNFTFIGKLRLLVIFIGLTFSISCKKEKSCSDCESNKPPVANAGPNQAITLPTDSVSLNGGASYDPDGSNFIVFVFTAILPNALLSSVSAVSLFFLMQKKAVKCG